LHAGLREALNYFEVLIEARKLGLKSVKTSAPATFGGSSTGFAPRREFQP